MEVSDKRQVSTVPARQGDLEQIQSGIDALYHRLGQLKVHLGVLYGTGDEQKAKPSPGGRIPQIAQTVEDLSDLLGEIEVIVNRL